MNFNVSRGFKKLIVITAALIGLVLADNSPAGAGAVNDRVLTEGKQRPNTAIVGQSQTGASAPQANSRTSENSEPESQTQAVKDSKTTESKPLKDFKPTERIEADQAVDFPYDI